jgi:hypothetical protein
MIKLSISLSEFIYLGMRQPAVFCCDIKLLIHYKVYLVAYFNSLCIYIKCLWHFSISLISFSPNIKVPQTLPFVLNLH